MSVYLHGGDVWNDGNPKSWIDFSANLNPKGPPEEMLKILRESISNIEFYPEINMELPTYNISKYISMPKENILPTNGGIGALNLIIEEIRPKKVIILQPAFVEYQHLAENIGAEIINIPLLDEEGKINYNQDLIISDLDKDSILFICNPSNPIGCTMPQIMMNNIIKESKNKGTTLVIDEAFIEFAPGESVKKYVIDNDNLIIAGSLTKIFAIPGIRLGYICAHDKLIDRLNIRQTPWVLSSFANDITNALRELDSYIKETLYSNRIGLEYLTKELSKMGIIVYPSKGNYLFLSFKDLDIKITHLQEWLREYKILIRNCSNYVFLNDYYTRVAIKSPKENEMLVEKLYEYIHKETSC